MQSITWWQMRLSSLVAVAALAIVFGLTTTTGSSAPMPTSMQTEYLVSAPVAGVAQQAVVGVGGEIVYVHADGTTVIARLSALQSMALLKVEGITVTVVFQGDMDGFTWSG